MRLERRYAVPSTPHPYHPLHPRPSTHAFMLLPLPLSTMYGVFWAFCFSWSSATVPRGVSLELIFFRSCGARVKSAQGCRQNILQHPKCRAPHLQRPTASSSSFFIRRSVFILPEPFPWKRWDSCRKAWGYKTQEHQKRQARTPETHASTGSFATATGGADSPNPGLGSSVRKRRDGTRT